MFAFRNALFLIYVYSGMRSAFNLTRSFFLQKTGLCLIDRQIILLDENNLATIRVHSRPVPKSVEQGSSAGMISVFLHSPGITRFNYALFRLTSHFGLGHIEIAFYEDRGAIVIFAIRNMLQANIDRIGLTRFFADLKLTSRDDEIMVLQQIVDLLGSHGKTFSFALPENCVKLAVHPALLNPETERRNKEAIRSNYKRVVKKINCKL